MSFLLRFFRGHPKAWRRVDHPPLRGAARDELATLVREQAERVRRALEPLPRSSPNGLAPMRQVHFDRRVAETVERNAALGVGCGYGKGPA